jgi:hypothetical protein
VTRDERHDLVTLVAIGDIGEPHGRDPKLHASLARRLEGADGAPIVVLGDVFYEHGLLGFCRAEGERVSKRGCAKPGRVGEQLDAVLGPYARKLAGHPVVAVAGNHDHCGDPEATANACALIPGAGPGWRYVARGCELDDARPVAVVDAGALVVVAVDSEAMLRDAAFRARSADALHAELARLRQVRPDAWLALAMHHPLESYGAHGGAGVLASLHKDLYPLVGLFTGFVDGQQVYDWRNRALRRALYRALADAPVDVVLAGHDHSLQLVELDHPGAHWQIVSGAGAKHTRVQRWGLDLWFANRLARLVGLRDALPAVRHRLLFAAGKGDDRERAGFGYAVLVAAPDALRVEFWDLAGKTPLGVAQLAR